MFFKYTITFLFQANHILFSPIKKMVTKLTKNVVLNGRMCLGDYQIHLIIGSHKKDLGMSH